MQIALLPLLEISHSGNHSPSPGEKGSGFQSRLKSFFMAQLKAIASAKIDSFKQDLIAVSSDIWKKPEVAYEEHEAHQNLTNFLEKKGFTVERSYTGIETAFRATFGSGRPNVCVICEYDALPEIGHACGHNLIAEAGVAAGLGLKAVLESSDAPKGMVTVLGTPAEENGGGKIDLLGNGAFDEIDISMMIHPAPYSILKPIFVKRMHLKIKFASKTSQDNALDAAILAYTSISHMRQQMKTTCSIHGIIVDGGCHPNLVPDKSVMEYEIRGLTTSDAHALYKRARTCFEAAANATGCQVIMDNPCKSYDDLNCNSILADLYLRNVRDLGVVDIQETKFENGSTDMGNVSYAVPSIHPMYKIGNGEMYHTRDFKSVTNIPEAHSTTLQWAKAMAHTCVDVMTGEGILNKIKQMHTYHNN